ncbi:MAG: hypothetical protein AB8B55_02595 [Mariniblastus sp.]
MYEFKSKSKSKNKESKKQKDESQAGFVERLMRSIVVAAGLIALGVAMGFC